MTIAVLITDGAGVRNFLLGPFLRHATSQCRTTIFHQVPQELLHEYGLEGAEIEWQPLVDVPDSRLTLLLRNTLAFAHMHWSDTASMRYALGLPFGGSWRTRLAMRAARTAGRLAASQPWIRRLDRWHASIVSRGAEMRYYRALLHDAGASVLFCSNQRAVSAVPAVLAAKALGIPSVAFVFSWDNLSSKGRIAAPFDYYFVWSELMRTELARYYPDVPSDRVLVVGTPQFEPYVDPTLLRTREEFFASIGADPSRPLICYSGGDRSIYPAEPEFVRTLLELIRTGRIERRPQVFLRPSPVDEGSRYAGLRCAYPELIYGAPSWLVTDPSTWSRVIPQRRDVIFLANLTHHADLNVNLASTMTLDFAIHDKPVVNVAFDATLPPLLGVPLGELYYSFEHYRPVVRLGAARLARSADELAGHINDYLRDPALDRENRRRFVALEVGPAIGGAGARIVQQLMRIAHEHAHVPAAVSAGSALVPERATRTS